MKTLLKQAKNDMSLLAELTGFNIKSLSLDGCSCIFPLFSKGESEARGIFDMLSVSFTTLLKHVRIRTLKNTFYEIINFLNLTAMTIIIVAIFLT